VAELIKLRAVEMKNTIKCFRKSGPMDAHTTGLPEAKRIYATTIDPDPQDPLKLF
jgi:hypothetical protein